MKTYLENDIAELLAPLTGLSADDIIGQIKAPKDINFGDFAFPVFMLAKERKMAPPKIAEQIVAELSQKLPYKNIAGVNAVGGFINFAVNPVALARQLLPQVHAGGEDYGSSDMGKGKKSGN